MRAVGSCEQPSLRVDLEVRHVELAEVRGRVTAWLVGHGVGEEDVRDLELATTEAVANVLEHAYRGTTGGWLRLRGELDRTGVVQLAVEDGGVWPPPGPRDDERGRGLVLLRAAVDELDVERGRVGTTVRMWRRVALTGGT